MRVSTAARAAAPTCSSRATRPSSSSPRRSAAPRSSSTPRATSARHRAGASGTGGCASMAQVRVPVDVAVERIVVWPDLRCAGAPRALGAPLPGDPPPPQRPPATAPAPRIDSAAVAKRVRRTDHTLLAYCGADGYPVVLPVELGASGRRDGIELRAAGGAAPGRPPRRPARTLLPPAARRPRHPPAHGWLESGRYAPHTADGLPRAAEQDVPAAAQRPARQARRPPGAAGRQASIVHGRSRGSQRGTAARYAS